MERSEKGEVISEVILSRKKTCDTNSLSRKKKTILEPEPKPSLKQPHLSIVICIVLCKRKVKKLRGILKIGTKRIYVHFR